MTANEIIAAFRAQCEASPSYKADAFKGWNLVCDAIQADALAKRPKPKVFEVHHTTEIARLAYVEHMLASGDCDLAASAALTRVGL